MEKIPAGVQEAASTGAVGHERRSRRPRRRRRSNGGRREKTFKETRGLFFMADFNQLII
jgi:hypothetical protein